MAEIPRRFHFIFGLMPQPEPMHVVHWLCLESCRRVNAPEAIHFHYRHEPHGEWWEAIRPHLILRRVDLRSRLPDASRYDATDEGRFIRDQGLAYAHEADFLRLQILLEEGGVYADMDSLFLRPLPERFFAHDFVLGEEAPMCGADGVLRSSLCNALIMARSGAAFARHWADAMAQSFDGTWSRHSNQAATALWAERPDEVHILPQPYFYKHAGTVTGVRALLEGRDRELEGAFSLHLWAHLWWDAARTDFTRVHAGMLTPDHIRIVDTTYNLAARRFLPEALPRAKAPGQTHLGKST
jgi:hypothetical protein